MFTVLYCRLVRPRYVGCDMPYEKRVRVHRGVMHTLVCSSNTLSLSSVLRPRPPRYLLQYLEGVRATQCHIVRLKSQSMNLDRAMYVLQQHVISCQILPRIPLIQAWASPQTGPGPFRG